MDQEIHLYRFEAPIVGAIGARSPEEARNLVRAYGARLEREFHDGTLAGIGATGLGVAGDAEVGIGYLRVETEDTCRILDLGPAKEPTS